MSPWVRRGWMSELSGKIEVNDEFPRQTRAAYRQLAELYRAVRLYVNFFQPSMKLRTKTRTGSRVRRTYGPAQTPFQRVLASGVLDVSNQRRLKAVYPALDPVRLLHQLETLQEALWRHALFRTRGNSPTSELMALRFDLSTCG